MTIDWSKEIEAVHPDGRVFKTTLIRTDDEGRMVRWLVGESPWSGMFTENGVAVLGGGWTIRNISPTPMEFGPEIKVDGVRPDYVRDDDQVKFRYFDYGHWSQLEWSACEVDWKFDWLKLPANHPHYITPTPDERAVAPELVARLVGFAKKVSEVNFNISYIGDDQNLADEARAIVAVLEPVDRVEARRLAGIWEIHEEAAYQILARGRQLEKEGK